MTISNIYRFIFFHVPKTAGTSIYKLLMQSYQAKHRYIHKPAEQAIIKIDLKRWNKYFKFSIVRNPFDRMVSWYKHLIFEADQNKSIIHPGSFENFIKNYQQERIDRKPSTYGFRQNQIDFLSIRGKCAMDYIMRFETINQDWIKVSDLIGLPYQELGHYKQTKKVDYHDYYTLELIDIMNIRFKKDLNYFDYKY